MSMTTILPNEVMAMVLSKLGLRDVTRAGRVCKKWRELLSDKKIMRDIAKRDFDPQKWEDKQFNPGEEFIRLVVILVEHGDLPTKILTTKASSISTLKQTSTELLKSAAVFAHLNLLPQVNFISRGQPQLWGNGKDPQPLDFSNIPDSYLAALAMKITGHIEIYGAVGDLSPFIRNLQCGVVVIGDVVLTNSEVSGLVTCMETAVKNVTLSNVKLPIAALTQYAGTGACNNFGLFGDGELFNAYCLELDKWAEERGWEFEEVHEYGYEYGLCNVKRADN